MSDYKKQYVTIGDIASDPDHPITVAAREAGEARAKGNPAFDCRRCGAEFRPGEHRWIFHKLCDACFNRFDEQKMRGRLASMGLVPEPSFYTEDVATWIEHDVGRTS